MMVRRTPKKGGASHVASAISAGGPQRRCPLDTGGGVQSGFKDLAHKMADVRIEEAEGTGAEVVTSPCPFCTYALSEAGKRTGTKIKAIDFAELMLEFVD